MLGQELAAVGRYPVRYSRGRTARPSEPLDTAFRLAFNGELSDDERRMAEQGSFDGPASWEP